MQRTLPTLLLTRPAAASAGFAAAARARFPGLEVVVAPLMEIEAVAFPPGLPAAGLIFTSAEAPGHFGAGDPRRGLDAWCVGGRTAAAARAAGFAVQAVAPDAEALLAQLLARRPAGPLLHARGAHARGDLAARLAAAGVPAAEVVVYAQPARPLSAAGQALLQGTRPVAAALFSPRSAALLVAAVAGARAPLSAAAISPAAAEGWRAAGLGPLELAPTPDGAGMLAALARLFAADPAA